jgi:two-component sensor histidine kinase
MGRAMSLDINARRLQFAGRDQAPTADRGSADGLGVTNRLCVVAGLVHIQATSIGAGVVDPQAVDITLLLEQTGRRIDAVVGLKRCLAASQSGCIELDTYLRDICDAALACSARPDATTLHFYADPDCHIRPVRALSIGLVLGELATNAIRFAHPTGVHGVLQVECIRESGGITLTVADDGIGFPEHFDPRQSPHLGLRIVCALADQLGAVLDFDDDELGLTVRMQVPIEQADIGATRSERRDASAATFIHTPYPTAGAAKGAQMNPILLFLRSDAAFDPELVASMGRAFDLACAAEPGDNTSAYREQIAAHIISLARRGVRDPRQLCDGALACLHSEAPKADAGWAAQPASRPHGREDSGS